MGSIQIAPHRGCKEDTDYLNHLPLQRADVTDVIPFAAYAGTAYHIVCRMRVGSRHFIANCHGYSNCVKK